MPSQSFERWLLYHSLSTVVDAQANPDTQATSATENICRVCSAKVPSRSKSLQLVHHRSLSTQTTNGRIDVQRVVEARRASESMVEAFSTISPRATFVDIKNVQQTQMLSDFLHSHFPTEEAKASLSQRRSYLTVLPDLTFTSPLPQGAVDTLCFAYLGSKHGDPRLILQSQALYGKVLTTLVKAIGAPTQQTTRYNARDILASIMLLCMYDDSMPPHQQSSNGWIAHYWGALQFLQAHGPGFIDLSNPFDRLLLSNLRMPALFIGIAQRKAILIAEPKWRAVYAKSPATRKSLANLFDKAMCMPMLIQQTDKLVSSGSEGHAESLKRLCEDLIVLRQSLLHWSAYEMHSDSLIHQPVVGVSDFDAFDMELEEHVFMTANSTFQTFHQFPNCAFAIEQSTFWMLSLLNCCIILRVLHFFPDASVHFEPLTQHDIEREMCMHASDLCRCMYYFSKSDSLALLRWTDLYITMAQNLFEEMGALREVGWCQGARIATQLHLDRITPRRPRSLCRLGDLAPEFATVAQYKRRNVRHRRKCPVHAVT